jgi:murein DD-endopeptidase MepM/ murein hydrolase activator NlpD
MRAPVNGARYPTTGKLSFGFKRSPTHTHQGVDVVAPKGTPVHAVASGEVEHAVTRPGTPGFRGYGRVVVLRLDTPRGTRVLYAHLDSVAVSKGQRVVEGDVLGTVGDACDTAEDPDHRCGGAHLHFEVSPRAYPQNSEATRLDPGFFLVTRRL